MTGDPLPELNREMRDGYAQAFRSLEKRDSDAAACTAMLNGGGG
jgi:hypothetical protein